MSHLHIELEILADGVTALLLCTTDVWKDKLEIGAHNSVTSISPLCIHNQELSNKEFHNQKKKILH
uniref:Uncharacterized protein n=1 Tax=Megaselia scalaris TaxID=36166 RepID=T1GKE8_MEGSC